MLGIILFSPEREKALRLLNSFNSCGITAVGLDQRSSNANMAFFDEREVSEEINYRQELKWF